MNDDIAAASPKGYSSRELQEIAATVPAIYDQIASGTQEQDFLDMRLSSDARERQMGETYSQLFRDWPSSAPLAAAFDGADLVVDKGNHRITAAREIGIPVLPVWVSASSEEQLQRVEASCNRRIEREDAARYRDAHESHEASIRRDATGPGRIRGEGMERGGRTGPEFGR